MGMAGRTDCFGFGVCRGVSVLGTDSQRLFVVNMRKAEGGADHLMVVDGRGRVQYATSHLADLLGTTPKAMVKQEFCKFMAQPFQQLHTRWMKVRCLGWTCIRAQGTA